jgi:cytochrome c-type biogenesis protein CcmH
MQQELVASVGAGKSDQEILQSFIDTYGTTVLSAPTTSGFDLVAWLIPYITLALGIAGVVFVAYAWRKRRPVPVASSPPGARASADLDRFRQQAREETEL